MKNNIKLHSNVEFKFMRAAGQLAAECLDFITDFVKPGISTLELNDICHEFQISKGAVPAPLDYKGFPKSICTSVNHVICHGIPSDKILQDGDIINIDVTPILNGWHGDTSRMFYVGKVKLKARKLVEITYEAMMRGIEIIKPVRSMAQGAFFCPNFWTKVLASDWVPPECSSMAPKIAPIPIIVAINPSADSILLTIVWPISVRPAA